jgi:hypothetical protein
MPVTITGSNTPTAGGVTYGDGATYANTAAGTSGQVLLSNGASAPTWGTAGAATTATNLAGGVAGAVPYQSGAGATGFSAAGTSGQVLKSNGASAPSWITPSSGALVFISSATASSSATIDFTGLSSTYDVYVVEIVSAVPATGSYLYMRSSSNNGSSYDTSGYEYSGIGTQTTNGNVNVDSSYGAAALMPVSFNGGPISTTASDSGCSGFVYIMNPAAANYTQFLVSENHYGGSGGIQSHGTGIKKSTTPVNAIRFYANSGNIASGTFRLYGIANS